MSPWQYIFYFKKGSSKFFPMSCSILFQEGIIKIFSYERRAYESIDEKSLSYVMSRKIRKKKNLVLEGLIGKWSGGNWPGKWSGGPQVVKFVWATSRVESLLLCSSTCMLWGWQRCFSTAEDGMIQLSFRTDRNLFDLRKLRARTWYSAVSFLELQYADDCALAAHSELELQLVPSSAADIESQFCFCINTEKTIILFQPCNADQREIPGLVVDEVNLKVVDEFKHLGGFISKDCSLNYEVIDRINQACLSYGRMKERVFERHNISLKTKVPVYKDLCLSVLL